MTRDPLFWQQQYLKIYTKNVSRDNAGQNLNQNNMHGPTNRIKLPATEIITMHPLNFIN